MASTPAVGPRPTTRMKTKAHTNSGTLRSSTSNQRKASRKKNGALAMRPGNMESDIARLDNKHSGTANSSARVMPAVAMATVRQVSRATRLKNSGPTAGGKKLARKRPLVLRLSACSNVAGRNSVATKSGHNKTKAADTQKTRLHHAGSRRGGSSTR